MSEGTEFVPLLSTGFLNEFETRQLSPVEAFPTPFSGWNRHCRDDGGGVGIAPGWFVTVGGNPGHGKSLIALNIAAKAMGSDVPVCFLSLEMSRFQLAARLFAIQTGEEVRGLEKGSFDAPTFERVRQFVQVQQAHAGGAVQFFVNRNPIVGSAELLSLMRFMHEDNTPRPRLYVVDYMQLAAQGDDDSIYRSVAELATGLRMFAHSTQTTVLGLSQFNRSTSANYTDSPRPQGLHGGMALEANSDQVVLLDHSRWKRDPFVPHLARTWFLLAKNRHGGAGEIPVLFDFRTLQIREGLEDEEHAWPKHEGQA